MTSSAALLTQLFQSPYLHLCNKNNAITHQLTETAQGEVKPDEVL